MRRACPACGGAFLRGVRALVVGGRAAAGVGSAFAVVCKPCGDRGVLVVAVDVDAQREHERQRRAAERTRPPSAPTPHKPTGAS